MFGILLALSSSVFGEVSDIIGKRSIQKRKASVYTVGFLTLIFGILFLAFSAMKRGVFVFSMASLPTLIPRILLEIVLSVITITALGRANRSTFGFVRTLTTPLLLLVDLIMGYALSDRQIIGVVLISVILLLVSLSNKISKEGISLLFISAILPVATLSLYKYDINHFNSFEAEQIIVSFCLLIFFYLMAIFKADENPFTFLTKRVFLFQAVMSGLGTAVGSFAYDWLAPSIATAALRSGAVFSATISGDIYFKEKHRLYKFSIAILIVLGLLFLA
ncbi:MAG: hypothetical protein HYV68_01220 [Candidatus Taylorbacteria bacterium]|nr:hypothetical protein [Candidatus Taylorbacteria bacterium]